MILKSVEIRGFKSFADFTELTFNKGITAVVGPNGSGKSNISDAIRWCLGEQSVKTLRGGKMEDVIFSGTQFRKAVSLAQVSITIDNSKKELPIEYSTVTVSRKLYRSGESEYLINNKVCKLKDIHELFFDTGIGKEGYSLIGQGKIEAILNGKIDDRRALIEEAIGITKYKFKKEEAQNKINHANENLIRINDILNTYYEYLEPLYIEQNKAKQFLEFSSELKEIEVSLILNKLYQLYFEMINLKQELVKHQNEFSDINVNKHNLEKNINDLEKHLDDLTSEEREKKENYYKIKDEIQSYINKVNSENNNINILLNSNKIYKKQMDENISKISNINSKENIINKTKLELENEFNQLVDYLDGFEKIFTSKNNEIETLNSQLGKIKCQELEIFERNTTIKNKIEFINSKYQSLQDERRLVFNEKQMLEKKVLDMENEIQEQEFQRELKYQDLLNNQKSIDDLSLNIDDHQKKLEFYKLELDKLNKSVIVQKTNLNMLVQFESNYDGFNRTSKILMNEINSGKLSKFKDKCFIIGSIFNTKQEYELAIETAIGGHISDIIVDDDNIAREIINYLKQNNIGRVTFHPLNLIKEFNIKNFGDFKSQNGFIDFAINLVNVEEKFIKVAKNILGKTIICDNIDNGVNIAKFANFSNKIVTLDSQIINSGGSITGGSNYSKNVNIIGRKRKIEEQNLNINRELLKIKQVEENFLNFQKKHDELKENLKKLNSYVQDLKINLLKLDNELNFKNENKLREVKEIDKKNNLLAQLDELILKNKSDIDELNNEFVVNEEMNKKLKLDIDDINSKIDTFRRQIKDEEDKITFDKIRKGKLEENISNICQEIERITLEKKEILLINQNIQKEFDNIEFRIKYHNLNINELQDKINLLTEQNKESEEGFDKYIIEQNELKNKIKELSTYIEDANQNVYKVEGNINSLQIKLVKFETEFNTLNEKLLNEYNIEFNESESEKYSLKESKINLYNQKMKSLKNNISDLGNVNLKAIEEYEELNKKVEFITKQKEDLDKSKQELEQFIGELTVKMKEIFSTNFKIINENFDKTFKELFRGGSASLLLGEGDELESSIDIVVQPPGKRLQNLNLLSGGEKGLSAISLLFAILRMKPVPFCVLDEIEAALDDNNVLRFAEFLKEFSSNIQFIVITHRKTTMESSDIIYGVTMQEKGISKIVSINLANYGT